MRERYPLWVGKRSGCPQENQTGGEPVPNGARTSLVHFDYHTGDFEAGASFSCRRKTRGVKLAVLLETFLTTLTWLCSTNGSSTEGWLTVAVSGKRSLWRVRKGEGDGSPLALTPVGGRIPASMREAARHTRRR